MAEIESQDELSAEQLASMAYYVDAPDKGGIGGAMLMAQAFRAGWLAGRDWEREQAAAAAQAEEERLAEIREVRERAELVLHPRAQPALDRVRGRAVIQDTGTGQINVTMAMVYETRSARRDVAYRGWITETNDCSLRLTGASIYAHPTLTPARMRRWYLAGLTPYDAVKRIQGKR